MFTFFVSYHTHNPTERCSLLTKSVTPRVRGPRQKASPRGYGLAVWLEFSLLHLASGLGSLVCEVGAPLPQHQAMRTVRAAPSWCRGLRGAGLTPRSQGPLHTPQGTQLGPSPGSEGDASRVGPEPQVGGHSLQRQLRPHFIPGSKVAEGKLLIPL